jgi:hypothetical protein
VRPATKRISTTWTLKISPVTVRRDWSAAKIWLYRELTGQL